MQIDTFKQNENGEYTEHLHSASCQIKVFKVGLPRRAVPAVALCWTAYTETLTLGIAPRGPARRLVSLWCVASTLTPEVQEPRALGCSLLPWAALGAGTWRSAFSVTGTGAQPIFVCVYVCRYPTL